jgi:hypothetical protein
MVVVRDVAATQREDVTPLVGDRVTRIGVNISVNIMEELIMCPRNARRNLVTQG